MQRHYVKRLGERHLETTTAAFTNLVDGLSRAVDDAIAAIPTNTDAMIGNYEQAMRTKSRDAALDVFRAVKGHDPLTRGHSIRNRDV